MRARMHSYGLAAVAGMLPGRHVGVAGVGDRVLVSSTLHAGYVCMVGDEYMGHEGLKAPMIVCHSSVPAPQAAPWPGMVEY